MTVFRLPQAPPPIHGQGASLTLGDLGTSGRVRRRRHYRYGANVVGMSGLGAVEDAPLAVRLKAKDVCKQREWAVKSPTSPASKAYQACFKTFVNQRASLVGQGLPVEAAEAIAEGQAVSAGQGAYERQAAELASSVVTSATRRAMEEAARKASAQGPPSIYSGQVEPMTPQDRLVTEAAARSTRPARGKLDAGTRSRPNATVRGTVNAQRGRAREVTPGGGALSEKERNLLFTLAARGSPQGVSTGTMAGIAIAGAAAIGLLVLAASR